MTSVASVHDSLIGQALGHYRIIQRIGSGGMGVVYQAHDGHLDREVAIKVLPLGTLADDASRRRFRNEALTLSKLNHPNVATIYDFDCEQELDFLVMEYIPGITLNDKLSGASLAEREVVTLGSQLAEGLAAAHERDIIHRDLKPGNLRVTPDGRLKILDFGLAKLRAAANPPTETISESHALAGTMPYMAPEQLLGREVDARTDIHAAGAVLYEMATGRRAFAAAERSQLIGAILNRVPSPADTLNPRLSAELVRIVAKCLEKEPENRYQSAKELAIDLRRLQSGASSETQARAEASRWRPPKAVQIGLLLLTFVGMALLGLNFGKWRRHTPRTADAPRIQSLAVLPLTNLSGDPQQEYFADGMTEELITNLGKVAAVRVISRTSVMQYKQATKALPAIAAELNVDAVVEGSVMRSGNRIRITAQLIEAKADRHLWGDSYEREASDVLALQSDVAQAIAAQIQAKLTPQEHRLPATVQSVNPTAHEAYLRGRYHWSKMTEEELRKAREYFEQAIQISPDYAPPYAGLADYYAESYELPSGVQLQKARQYAEKALALDDTLAEAHLSLGNVEYHEWHWTEAQQQFSRTLQLNPSYADAHRRYSMYLSALGRKEEAWAEIQTARNLDPFSLSILGSIGWVAYFARDYDQAIQQCSKVAEVAPNNVDAYECMGLSYMAKGNYDQAAKECQKAMTLSGADPDRMVCLGQAYAAAGRAADAHNLLQEMYRASHKRNVPPYFFALMHGALDEKEKAFEWLGKSYQERDPYLVWLKVSPAADSLRGDPRFDWFVQRVGPVQ